MKTIIFCACVLLSSAIYAQINVIQKNNSGITISPNGIRGSLPVSSSEDSTNISMGENALKSNVNSKRNIAIGKDALMTYSKAFNSGDLLNASQLAIGFEALRNYTTTGQALNIAIGTRAMGNITQDGGSIAIGHFSMENNRGGNTVAIGHRTLSNGSTDTDSGVFIGDNAGAFAPSGGGTVAIGSFTMNYGGGAGNTLIGSGAGGGTTTSSKIGSRNIMIGLNAGKTETGDDKLYIENTNSSTPLIGGNFATDRVGINRLISDITTEAFTFQIGGNALITNGLKLTNLGEADGKVLRSDANGNASWAALPSLWQTAGAAGNEIQNTNAGGFWSNNPGIVPYAATDITNPPTAPVDGAGTRMMWIPSRSAFRCGTTNGDAWDAANIGLHSFASGYNSVATGVGNVAFGTNAISDGTSNTLAFGENTHATGENGVAIGYGARSNSHFGVAIGNFSFADGSVNTIAIGENCNAFGNNGIAIGTGTGANAYYSMAMGYYNILPPIANATTWVATDPLFTIGNGQSSAARSNAMLMLKNGRTAIGNTTPESYLHVFESESGATPSSNAIATFEKNGIGYLSILTPEASENGISFGVPSNSVSGGIYYNSAGSKGLQFRTGGNNTKMSILSNGNVGIGTSPNAKLDVSGDIKLGTNGTLINEIIKTTLSADLPSINAAGTFAQTFTVTNAALGSTVHISPEDNLNDGIIIANARVSAAGTVTVKFTNITGSAINPASMNFHLTVIR
ncbi:hypothetical protein [Runella sp.]|uniref:hypothetical protein n=1 Tax=Runella sp. TaxID=1960881 RepID=UPI003D145172